MSTHRLLDDSNPAHASDSFAAPAASTSLRKLTCSDTTMMGRVKALPRWVVVLVVMLFIIGFIAIVAAIAASAQKRADNELAPANGNEPSNSDAGRSQADIDKCLADHANTKHPVVALPRVADGVTPRVLIQNGTVHDGLGHVFEWSDILMEGGVITQIGIGLPAAGAVVINALGRHVTPGLVDLHSHVGVYSWPGDLFGNSDGNEVTSPTTPYVRSIDALNPMDPAIQYVLEGGTVTSQVLPGSANTMGGESTVIKHKFSSYLSDIVVPEAPRGIKQACGENPKRVYGSRNQMPSSRMGNIYVMRAMYEKARDMLIQQREWCSRENPEKFGAYPDPIELHSLMALLTHKALLHQHCYKIHDFQAILRLADEFGFYISAFHHSSEAYKIPNLLKNITVATWADWWGFKTESEDGSVYAPAILEMNNVPLVIKSDDVVVSKYLAFEAAKAHHYGLSMNGSIIAITSQPAVALGLQNRLGSIKPGLDADVLIWDSHPLQLGARPDHIFIEGVRVGGRSSNSTGPAFYPQTVGQLSCPTREKPRTLSCYALNGVDVFTMTDESQPKRGQTVLVQKGFVSCVASKCSIPISCQIFNLPGGIVTPGLIESGSGIGQASIGGEAVTHDGTNVGSGVDQYSSVQAHDGIHVSMRHVDAARIGGVLTSINSPEVGKQLVVGLSTVFHTLTRINNGEITTTVDDVTIQERVALHLSVGNSAKSGTLFNSFSGQMTSLRSIFKKASTLLNGTLDVTDPNWAFVQALQGSLPVAVYVNNADQIVALLHIQKVYGFRMIIQGGAEAHLVAKQLARSIPPTSVILTSRQSPSTYETLRASDWALGILLDAGVKVGIQIQMPDTAFNLRWELGWQVVFMRDYSGQHLSTYQALQLATTNVVEIFGITNSTNAGSPARGMATEFASGLGMVKVGTPANFVVYNGDPLGVESSIQFIGLGKETECRPRQWLPHYLQ